MFLKISHHAGKWLFRIGTTFIIVVMAMQMSPQFNVFQIPAQAQGDTGGSGEVSAGNSGPGMSVEANFTQDLPPLTAQQRKELRQAENQSNRDGPPIGETVKAVAEPGAGLPEPATAAANALAPDTFKIFRNTFVPKVAVGGSWGNVSGRAPEPSTGVNGKNIFQTGNWYAARSLNNGGTWTYVNPYTIFGKHPAGNKSFCCDQVTLYDPIHHRQWWVLQYGTGQPGQGGLKIANSNGTSLFRNWCYWNIDARWFGYPNATDAGIDYNDMAISKNYLYISSNLFPAAGGKLSGILKLPIDKMITCSGFTYYRYTDPTHFTFKLVQGAHETMYWGSNWANPRGWTCQGCTNGNAFRVYQWTEATNALSFVDRSIAPFVFYTRNSGQNCASASGAVKNWCAFSDSRVLGGAVSNGVIHFSFNAKQTTNRPFPYTRWVRFRESDKAYLGYWDLFAQWGALLFLSISPNNDGAIGGTFAWGGGRSTNNFYPGSALLLNDDYTTDVGNTWTNGVNLSLWGQGNPCTSGGLYRWGDYLTARPFYPAGYAFVATNYRIVGNNCGSTGWRTETRNVVFGRGRDQVEYNRWRNK